MRSRGRLAKAQLVSRLGRLGRDAVPPVGAADPVTEAAGAAGGVEARPTTPTMVSLRPSLPVMAR